MLNTLSDQKLILIAQQRTKFKHPRLDDILREFLRRDNHLPNLRRFLPYPDDTQDLIQLRVNASMRRAYRDSRQRVEITLQKPKSDSCPFKGGWMSFDAEPGAIQVEPDDGPQYVPTANYSGVLQGGYMGSRYRDTKSTAANRGSIRLGVNS